MAYSEFDQPGTAERNQDSPGSFELSSQLAEIHGTKWNDLNADGIHDPGEPGLPDWTIYLDQNNNGQFDGGSHAIEDFETGDLSALPWVNSGDAGWVVTPVISQSGVFSAQAGLVADDQLSHLEVTLETTAGNLEFARMVSSEADFDFLRFFIDDVEQAAWSGIDPGFIAESFPVTAGVHTFRWSYEKDFIFGDGLDTAFIDDIDFPTAGGEPSTLTDANGSYSFTGLEAGSYTVAEVLQLDWEQTFPGAAATAATEDFETGDFSAFPWISSGDAGWAVTPTASQSGAFSTEAGPITDDQSSHLEVTRETAAGNIEFARMVSSEADFDFLRFFIDDVEQGAWSGIDPGFIAESFPVTAGVHTLRWSYEKDFIFGDGLDTAFLDDIVFPVAGPGPGTHTVDLASGQIVEGVDFGNASAAPQLAEIRGTKWNDLNANGVRDSGESGLEGWHVYVDLDENAQYDAGEPDALSDANGDYLITGLPAGAYAVAEEPQPGWQQTSPTGPPDTVDVILYETGFESDEGYTPGWIVGQAGWSADPDSDSLTLPAVSTAHPQSGTHHLRLHEDREVDSFSSIGALSPDLGPQPSGRYTVSLDVAISDSPSTNFDIEVLAPSQGLPAATVTFSVLGEIWVAEFFVTSFGIGLRMVDTGVVWQLGTYRNLTIEIDAAADTIDYYYDGALIHSGQVLGGTSVEQVRLSTPNSHHGEVADFDNLQISVEQPAGLPNTWSVELGPGEVAENINFGNFEPAEIRGSKWNDVDGDGQRDPGEQGLEGWHIYADLNQNNRFDAGEPDAVTNANGDYVIPGLVAGSYAIAEEVRPGWEQTFPDTTPSTEPVELLYETGFEQHEGFLPGFVDGQGGWTATIASSTQPTIATANPQTGDQHLRLDEEVGAGTFADIGGISPNLGPLPPGKYSVSVDVAISATDGADYFVIVHAPSQGSVTAEVDFSFLGTITVVDDLGFGPQIIDTGVSWVPGSYKNLTIQVDASADTINYFYDGTLIYSGTVYEGTAVEQVVLRSDNFNFGEVGDFDNLQIYSGLTSQAALPGTWSVDLGAGQLVEGIDFGNLGQPGEIRGSKWNDLDGDGVWDRGEPPIEGWHIYVDVDQDGTFDAGEPDAFTDADGHYVLENLQPGEYTVAEELLADWEQTFPVNVAEPPEYQVVIDFDPAQFTESQQQLLLESARRWSEIIVADVPDVLTSRGWVDDLLIEASAEPIDGPGNQIGGGRPLEVREGSFLPALGEMRFDSADLGILESFGLLDELFLHEMAHALGFGGIWQPLGLIEGVGGPDPRFVGLNATSQYNIIFEASETSVPVENAGPPGSAGVHWRETVFANELMSTAANFGVNPLSRITVGALQDMGYHVDFNAADRYQPPAADALPAEGFGTWEEGLEGDRPMRILPARAFDLGWFTAADAPQGAAQGIWTVEVGAAATVAGIDFGNRLNPAQIRGTKWHDMDGDSVRDPDEPGLEGWTIYLDLNNDGQLSGDEPRQVTSPDGKYNFTIVPGAYTVAELPLPGWEQTFPAGAQTHQVVADPGMIVENVDFGNHEIPCPEFLISADLSVEAQPTALAVGDFDRNGHSDLLAANTGSDTVSVLLGAGDGSYLLSATIPVDGSPVSLAVDDFNHDHRLDFAVVNAADALVEVFLGDGLGGFNSAGTYPVGTGPTSIVAADVDGDGPNDLIVSNGGSSSLSVLLGTGTGAFTAASDVPLGFVPGTIVAIDFNADGHFDLATPSFANGTVVLLAGNGTGAFLSEGEIPVGAGPGSLVVADFDLDARLDLAVANLDDNSISVLLADGGGSFVPASPLVLAGPPADLAVADFDGDSRPDLAVTSQGTSGVDVFLGHRDGSFELPTHIPLGGQSGRLVTGFFDSASNFSADLAVANPADSRIHVLLNRCLPALGALRGIKWHDLDQDGERDADEPGLADWHIFVDLNENGEWDRSEPDAWTGPDGSYLIPGLTAGVYVVDEVPQSGWQQTSSPAPFFAPSDYQIELNFSPAGFTESQKTLFEQAAGRWGEIIVGDVPDVVTSVGLVDDLRIDVSAAFIDGPGGIVGTGGPVEAREDSHLPALGIMTFDSADLVALEASGQLSLVILHEMAHVIGIGTIWSDLGLIVNEGLADPRFIGPAATAEYNAIFGVADGSVPVEDTGGSGRRDRHWRESVLGNELMTGALNAGANPISRITIASLADLGYEVNLDAADPYAPPGSPDSGSWVVGSDVLEPLGRFAAFGAPMELLPVSSQLGPIVPLYETGFEPHEGFVPGSVNGQEDWSTLYLAPPGLETGLEPIVGDARPRDGVQHLRIEEDPIRIPDLSAGSTLIAFGPQLGAKPAGRYLVSVDVAISETNGVDYSVVGLSSDMRTFWVTFSNSGVITVRDDLGSGSEEVFTNTAWMQDSYANLTIYLNAATDRIDYFYDGQLIYSGVGGVQGAGAVDQVVFHSKNRRIVFPSFLEPPRIVGDFDNLRVFGEIGGRKTPGPWTVALDRGQIAADVSFGNFALPGEIRGTKWSDEDDDGQRDTDEPGLADWTIYVDLDRDGQLDPNEPWDRTGPEGQYVIHVPAGGYLVSEVAQAGWVQTFPASQGSHEVSIATGEVIEGIDFGNNDQRGEIRGSKFYDLNHDGQRDEAEFGLPYWQVYVDLNDNGRFDEGEPFAVTDATGDYVITGVPPGTHPVAEVLRPGWTQTLPLPPQPTLVQQTLYETGFEAGDGFVPGAVDGQNDWTSRFLPPDSFGPTGTTLAPAVVTVNPQAGQQHLQLDADPGLLPGSPIGAISPDLGVQPPGEYTVSMDVAIGATAGADYSVTATAPSEGLVTALVNFLSDGTIWVLDDLGSGPELVDTGVLWAAGPYKNLTIQVAASGGTIDYLYGGLLIYSGSTFGGMAVEQVVLGSNNADFVEVAQFDNLRIDSTTVLAQAGMWTVDIGLNEIVEDIDFGNHDEALGISGTKFHDLDADGVRDEGEPGLEGWQVYVDLDQDNVLDANEPSALTNANGDYLIEGPSVSAYLAPRLVSADSQGETVLATGFEADQGFEPGLVDGQAGWSANFDAVTQPVIITAGAPSGAQHLQLAHDPNAGDAVSAFGPDFGPLPAGQFTISVDVAISEVGDAEYVVTAEAPSQGPGLSNATTAVIVFSPSGAIQVRDIDTYLDLGSSLKDTGADWEPGSYKKLTIQVDSLSGTIDYFYDGELIYSGFVFDGTAVEQVVLRRENVDSPDIGDFDNIHVSLSAQQGTYPIKEVLPAGWQQTLPAGGGAVIGLDAVHGRWLETGPFADPERFEVPWFLTGRHFDGFRQAITAAGHTTVPLTSFESSDLEGLDALFIVSPQRRAFTLAETQAIEDFVNHGGGLVVMGEYISPISFPLNALVEEFGATYSQTGSLPYEHTISGFVPHPLTDGVSSIAVSGQQVLADIEPPASDLTVGSGLENSLAAAFGAADGGNVVMLSDTELWRDAVSILEYSELTSSEREALGDNSIDALDNRRLLHNILRFVTATREHRIGNYAPMDFGDAPDPTYPTLATNHGAGHILLPDGPLLGAVVDVDANGQPGPFALDDDLAGNDDDDGVHLPALLVPGDPAAPVDIDMTASPADGYLNAWLDFNADGDWDDAGEQVFTDLLLTGASIHALQFPVPATAREGATFARFRLSTQTGLSFRGLAPDGEVEDYRVEIGPFEAGGVAGYKWEDVDGDSQRNPSEPGVQNWHIYVDLNNNGRRDPGEPDAWTDSEGRYEISGLRPGTYTVAEVPRPGSIQSFPVANPSDSGPAIPTVLTGQPQQFVGGVTHDSGWAARYETGFEPAEGFAAGPINGQLDWTSESDFSNFEPVIATANPHSGNQHLRLGDTDAFGNGSMLTISPDLGPLPPSRYAVSLDLALSRGDFHVTLGTRDGLTADVAFVDSPFYSIEILDPVGFDPNDPASQPFDRADTGVEWERDVYKNLRIEVDAIADTIHYFYDGELIYVSESGVFDGEAVESLVLVKDDLVGTVDVDNLRILVGETFEDQPRGNWQVEIAPGQTVEGLDFGNQLAGTIRGTKWADLDANGRRHANEPALENWHIYLDLNNNGRLDEDEPHTWTDENGDYAFRNIAPGTYTVAEVLQPGWGQSLPDPGPNGPAAPLTNAAVVVYTTGFEPTDGFALGHLQDQRGWTSLGNSPSRPFVSDLEAGSESQHIRIDESPDVDARLAFEPVGAASPDLGPLPAGRYVVSVDVAINNDHGLAEIGRGHQVVARTASQVTAQVEFGVGSAVLVWDDVGAGFEWVDTGADWVTGTYKNLTVVVDAAANTIDYFYDGTLIYTSAAGVFGAEVVEQIVLQSWSPHVDSSLPLDFTLDFDNVSLSLADYSGTSPSRAWNVEVSSGEMVGAVDFGNYVLGTIAEIRGTKWNDLDEDGRRTAGEPGLEGWHIYVDSNRNSQFDEGEPDDMTGADGNYLIRVPAGTDVSEGFETGDLSALPWSTSGDNQWIVTSEQSNSGTFSARAGEPGTIFSPIDSPAVLEVTLLTAPGSIEFSRLVSSSDAGVLRFFIDGVEQDAWFGEESSFSRVSFPVTAGTHTFRWSYEKLFTSFGGMDTALIDDIAFIVEPYTVAEELQRGWRQTWPDAASSGVAEVTLYETGFEVAEGFPPAPSGVAGSAGWTQLSPLGTRIQSDNPFAGEQHLRVESDSIFPPGVQVGAVSPDFGPQLPGRYTVSIEVDINDGIFDNDYFVIADAPSQGLTTAEVRFSSQNTIFGGPILVKDDIGFGPEFVNTGASWELGTYQNLTIEIDASAGTIDYFYGGDLFYTGGIYGGIAVEQVILAKTNGPIFVPDADVADFDNLRVTTDQVLLGTYTVSVEPGEVIEGIDFGNHDVRGEIHGTKFHDLDGDGARDADEPGLEDWHIYVDENQNGQFDAGEPDAISGADGSYVIEKVVPGTLTVAEVPQIGWEQTLPAIPEPGSFGQTLYETSFESGEGFVTGWIDGQAGWSATPDAFTQPNIFDTNPLDGGC